MLYLVWIDIKDEDLEFPVKVWWFLLVLLTHVPGYLIFRVWIAVRRHRARRRPMRLVPVPADVVETGQLERQLEREQVLLAQVQSGHALDPLEPLTHRVRVDVERPRARGHAAAIGEEALERLDQARAAAAVVLEQLLDRGR